MKKVAPLTRLRRAQAIRIILKFQQEEYEQYPEEAIKELMILREEEYDKMSDEDLRGAYYTETEKEI